MSKNDAHIEAFSENIRTVSLGGGTFEVAWGWSRFALAGLCSFLRGRAWARHGREAKRCGERKGTRLEGATRRAKCLPQFERKISVLTLKRKFWFGIG